VRRVCVDCREPYKPTAEELTKIGIDPDEFFSGRLGPARVRSTVRPPPPGMLYRANASGCARCSKTGYTGRSGIYELLLIDDSIRALALKNVDSGQIKRAAVERGMRTLRDDGALKVRAGMTTIEEVMLVTAEDRV
jgi:general secretion pathway protein E